MSKRPDIVVIAGISGVGKSYVINQLKEDSSHYVNFSAGTLIKKRRSNMARDQLRLLDQEGIMQNQFLLIEQLIEEVNAVPKEKTILFDAHMLIDTDDGVVEIPLDIFSKINPARFIYLYEDPETISERRARDVSRQRPIRTLDELGSQQDRSLLLVEKYAEQLDVPVATVAASDIAKIKVVLRTSNH